jgi:hypothetical protein
VFIYSPTYKVVVYVPEHATPDCASSICVWYIPGCEEEQENAP